MEIKIEEADDAPSRLTMLLWGDSGSGKTTLAATLPGRKLWLLFDPDGDQSIRSIKGWSRVNFTKERALDIMQQGVGVDPWNVSKLLQDFDTLVVDSLTKLSEHALHYAVSKATRSGIFVPTFERPGIEGYGLRNTFLGVIVSNILRITSQQNKHVVLITHERDGDRNDNGNIIGVRMMLGGQLPNVTSKDISEVWHLRDDSGKRKIAIRPENMRSPMKSRMFDMTSATSFVWNYNSNTGKGDTVAQWWEQYLNGRYVKLPLPK